MAKLKFGFLSTIILLLSSCGSHSFSSSQIAYSSKPPKSVGSSSIDEIEPDRRKKPFRVYDKALGDNPRAFAFTFALEEFGSEPFVLNSKGCISQGKENIVSEAEAVYIYDADNDGYRDFCLVEKSNDGYDTNRVYAYDLHNARQIFNAYEARRISYGLELRETGLYLKQFDLLTNEFVSEGEILHSPSKGTYVNWEKTNDISNYEISIFDAGPNHQPARLLHNDDVYEINVDTASTYFIDISVVSNSENRDGYPPVSFVSRGGDFFVDGVYKEPSLQRYSFFFPENQDGDVITDISVSNITKRVVFHVGRVEKYAKLKDLVKSVARSEQIQSLEMEVYKNEESAVISEVYAYQAESDFEAFLSFFDRPAFRVSGADFKLSPPLDCYDTTTVFNLNTVDGRCDFKVISRFFQAGVTWYDIRKPILLSEETAEKSLRFKKLLSDYVAFEPFGDNKSSGYRYDLTRTTFRLVGSMEQERIYEEAEYVFNIGTEVFYIVGKNEFVSADGLLYRVVSGNLREPVYG